MDTHVLKVVGWNPSTIYFSHLFVVKIVISVRKRLKINKKGWPILKTIKWAVVVVKGVKVLHVLNLKLFFH